MVVSAVLSIIIIAGVATVVTADTNVALGKPAKLYYACPHPNMTDTGYKAVDGNTNQTMMGNSCFETGPNLSNWWYVNLGKIYEITEVKLYNRIDCCSERAKNIFIMIGNSLEELKPVDYSPDPIGAIKSFFMFPNTKGKYVKLQHEANTVFHLCEVKVFAK
ncbi:fucolectin-1-like [Mercenaria mercenaria]|uniref:fucolectin-1-like n=1 Tax=Mercenaria mercenaria TaxID=6596 RepID=UPI00234E71EF|nr:fucolectin-1-like [Mercenaria mercenaria]